MTMKLLSAALLVLVLGFLYLVWALNGLAVVMYLFSFPLTAALVGLPWYLLGKRRERRIVREIEEAASKGATARQP